MLNTVTRSVQCQWNSWYINCVKLEATLKFSPFKMAGKCLSSSSLADGSDIRGHLKQCARQIFDAGVQAVLPNQMVKDALHLEDKLLRVNGQQYPVDHNVHVAAFGKAVAGMVRAAEDVLGDEMVGGIASVPSGIQKTLLDLNKGGLLPTSASKVKLIEGAKNNLPDLASLQAAAEISSLAEKLTDGSILLVLISGGGSALLPAPVPPISLDEKLQVIRTLAARGATIEQLNTVRKNLSTLKGGRLARIASPAKVISLILSDIIGDPLGLIASGPTVPDHSTSQDCLKIFQQFGIPDSDIPTSVLKTLRSSSSSSDSLSTSELDKLFNHVNNVIIGSNSIAASAAQKRAQDLGFATINVSNSIDGEARDAAAMFVDMATAVCKGFQGDGNVAELLDRGIKIPTEKAKEFDNLVTEAAQQKRPVCVIGAGETTVTVKGKGKGGRNQELALAAGIAMRDSPLLCKFHQDGFGIALLSAGTDGQDGPTDAAGALTQLSQVVKANQSGLDPEAYLQDNDSYTFYKTFSNGEDLVVTGLTGTNVMDLQILLVYPPGCNLHI